MIALRLGTRRSRLATTQSTHVAELLRARGHEVELVEIVTEGDRSNAPLEEIGGTGVFASALRAALRRGEVDLAVHSLKDLPTAPEPGLVIASIPAREDVRDAQHQGGWRDQAEDVRDAREDVRDAREDIRDRREDRWDRRENRWDRRH